MFNQNQQRPKHLSQHFQFYIPVRHLQYSCTENTDKHIIDLGTKTAFAIFGTHFAYKHISLM